MNRKLFRYIGFEDFINLTINNKDRFVRPSSWDDKYEGYLFSHMETPEDVIHMETERSEYGQRTINCCLILKRFFQRKNNLVCTSKKLIMI